MIENLVHMLKQGTSAALAVKEAERQLEEAGFQELQFQNTWGLSKGGKYYLKHHDTALFAFTIGKNWEYRDAFRLAAAHTDYPCFRVKPNPDMHQEGYAQVNVEVYGGAILNTWLDRPLGISGRVAVKSEDIMHPNVHLVDIQKPWFVIPNLAIHLNREVNKGVELNKQTDILPLMGTCFNQEEGLLHYLAEELQVKQEDILDYELGLSCLEQPTLAGIKEEFLLSPRLDNLTSCQALIDGLIKGNRKEGVNIIALFDHEEIGSKSKQGAGSMLLLNIMEKIGESFGKTASQIKESIYASFLLSVDVAQGTHPNFIGKSDPTTKPILNKGFCIKEASSQAYATDCAAVAVVEQICQAKDIPYQKYVNRSDMAGGGTLGSIVSAWIPIQTVDIGVPILAMHSAVETMGIQDQQSITRLMEEFFSI